MRFEKSHGSKFFTKETIEYTRTHKNSFSLGGISRQAVKGQVKTIGKHPHDQ